MLAASTLQILRVKESQVARTAKYSDIKREGEALEFITDEPNTIFNHKFIF